MGELDPRSGCIPRAESNILTLFRQLYSDPQLTQKYEHPVNVVGNSGLNRIP